MHVAKNVRHPVRFTRTTYVISVVLGPTDRNVYVSNVRTPDPVPFITKGVPPVTSYSRWVAPLVGRHRQHPPKGAKSTDTSYTSGEPLVESLARTRRTLSVLASQYLKFFKSATKFRTASARVWITANSTTLNSTDRVIVFCTHLPSFTFIVPSSTDTACLSALFTHEPCVAHTLSLFRPVVARFHLISAHLRSIGW